MTAPLAISQIAWPETADVEIGPQLRPWGATAVELVPGRLGLPGRVPSSAEIRAARAFWTDTCGLPIVAMQALLFGRPDLKLFGDAETRRRAVEYLDGVLAVAGELGAGVAVLGSPSNRSRLGRPLNELRPVVLEVFGELSERAAARGVWLGLEPNPPEYGCDLATTTAEALDLIDGVGRVGFGLHLDAAGLAMVGEAESATLTGLIARAGDRLRHAHISEPNLAPVGADTSRVPHAAIAATLLRAGYGRAFSVEMRAVGPGSAECSAAVRSALSFASGVLAEAERTAKSAAPPRDHPLAPPSGELGRRGE